MVKGAIHEDSIPPIVQAWLDPTSDACIFTQAQLGWFPLHHLVGGGWYIDCLPPFVPMHEKKLKADLDAQGAPLDGSFPEEELLFERKGEDNKVGGKKPRTRSRRKETGDASSSQVVSGFTSTPAPSSAVAPSSIAAPSSTPGPSLIPGALRCLFLALGPSPSAAASQLRNLHPSPSVPSFRVPPVEVNDVVDIAQLSEDAWHLQVQDVPPHSLVSAVTRKKRFQSEDTTATSSHPHLVSAFIEMVGVGSFVEHLMAKKVPHPIFSKVEDFIRKVWILYLSNSS